MSKRRYALASQEKQKKIRAVQELFLAKVCNVSGALITDESYLSDFLPYQKHRAIRIDAASGCHVFLVRRYLGPKLPSPGRDYFKMLRDRENWIDEEEFIKDPDPSNEELRVRILDFFGVDTGHLLDGYLVDLILYVVENYRPKV